MRLYHRLLSNRFCKGLVMIENVSKQVVQNMNIDVNGAELLELLRAALLR